MFSNTDIAEYYDTTQNHYEKWWGLKKHHSLHYGIWDKTTRNFGEALENTNRQLMQAAAIQSTDKVLDAGCGVGGAALFVHRNSGANATGISLSDNQVQQANSTAEKLGVNDAVQFKVMDFTATSFPDESFDVIWACESVCHATEKADFINESYRLLRKGGRMVLFDFFLTPKGVEDKRGWIDKWKRTWAVPDFVTDEYFTEKTREAGFSEVENRDYTPNIRKSARRMLYGSMLGVSFAEGYALLHPDVSRFARDHYKCGYYQYRALRQNLWKYRLIKAVK
ncbi:MAG: SAM-dependent methyltransferase [Owenweeksia sp.]|nr:SAM-dependent methyltransferase [Owenweeksia sp.]MBF99815.1 SAM-dependent methyltransferase [Owenweeksia sp.]HCQ15678.1 SAM-dependent methyltransferase [Cryomorphaceae bacterium]|tara:strand:+ start:2381 stop:3223 length:843 start_codon:yes stop_codon:yes gene_type:complete